MGGQEKDRSFQNTDGEIVRKVRDYYADEKIVTTYESKRYSTPERQFFSELEKEAVEELLSDVSGARLLEVGCGTGRFTRYLAHKKRIITIDASPAMMRYCLDRALEDGSRQNISPILADAFRIPLRDGSLDCVFSIHVLWHFPNYRDAIREIRRVLSDQGAFIFDFINAKSYLELARATIRRRKTVQDMPVWEERLTMEQVTSVLSEFGFSISRSIALNSFPFLYRISQFNESLARRIEKSSSRHGLASTIGKRIFVLARSST